MEILSFRTKIGGQEPALPTILQLLTGWLASVRAEESCHQAPYVTYVDLCSPNQGATLERSDIECISPISEGVLVPERQ